MLRIAFFLLLVAALAFVAVWVADNPGRVTLTWDNYRIESSVAVLVGATALLVASAILLYRLGHLVWHGPRDFVRERARRRERRGYLALTQGLVAVAAGDAKGARRLARRANSLLGEPPLTLLLSAQAAQLEGDEAGAHAYFEAMAARSETEFLGLRGLIVEAMKGGNDALALNLADRAHGLKTRTPWLLATLVDLKAQAGQWLDAEASLNEAAKSGVLGADELRRKRAVLSYGRARALAERGLKDEALAALKTAEREAPGLVPAALLHAQLLLDRGKVEAARHLVEAAWQASPHPALGELYLNALSAEPPIERFHAAQRLVGQEPQDLEGNLLLARAMMEAQLYGLARSRLDAAEKLKPSARVYRALAELAERETGDREAAGRLRLRADEAPPDAQWVCARCNASSPDWLMHCYNCKAFDRMVWREPAPMPRLAHAAAAPPALERGAAGEGDKAAGAKPRRSRWAAWLAGRSGAAPEARSGTGDRS
ncbi:MAG TPA: heme biosynthesis HemY N-terminal domain-containing protein [Alphaproteobacteria bacterium]|nr:heme biosynthesis HemY N-terminal domain-containing protein [Alphaproteobacteria bacterium]